MHTTDEIRHLLDELDERPANRLESQILDFKEWNPRNMKQAVDTLIEYAICMANGGGGTVVFGVNDKTVGRVQALAGVPSEVDVNLLKKAVYDSTDPKLTPVIDELRVLEGTGRLLVVHIFGGLPPYTDTQGAGKVRVGVDCQPLTGSLRRSIMVETGETDITAVPIPGLAQEHISPAAMEHLRNAARRERAPADLLQRTDLDLMDALGVLRRGQLTRAGVILAGNEPALR